MLYAIVGDGHDAGNAQDRTNNDRGKIIRITPDGDVPATNPFGDRVWALGSAIVRVRVRPRDRCAVGDGERPLVQRRGEPDPPRRQLRLGPLGGLRGRLAGEHEPRRPRPIRPASVYADPIGITGIAFCDRCGLGGASNGAAFHGSVNDGRVARLILNRTRTGIARRGIVLDHSATLSFEVGPRRRIYFSDFDGIYMLVRT
jgi:hypothetical protein